MGKIFPEKISQGRKKLKGGGTFSLTRYCMLRRKRKKNFFGSVLWANRYNIKICRTFGRTILGHFRCIEKKLTDEKP